MIFGELGNAPEPVNFNVPALMLVGALSSVFAPLRVHVPEPILMIDEPLEAFCRGEPVNFSLSEKTNSQDLPPVRRVTWSITGWRSATYLAAVQAGQCATYAGTVGLHSLNRLAGHVIKTADDLALAEALYLLVHQPIVAAGRGTWPRRRSLISILG